MRKHLFYLLLILALAGCAENPADRSIPIAKKPANSIQLESIEGLLKTPRQKNVVASIFLERNKADTSVSALIDWYIKLGDTLYKYNLPNISASLCDSASRLALSSKNETLHEKARVCYYKKAMRSSNYADELKEWEKYFALAPQRLALTSATDVQAATYFGDVYLRLGDKKLAAFYHDKALKCTRSFAADKRFFGAYLSKANALNQNGEYGLAVALVKEALLLPNLALLDYVQLNAVLCESYSALHQYTEAETAIKKALDLLHGQENEYALSYEIRLVYASQLEQAIELKAALKQYRITVAEGLALNNNSDKTREFSKLYKSFGDCFYKAGERDSALLYYHKALASVVKVHSLHIQSMPDVKDLYAENAIQEALDALADFWVQSGADNELSLALQAMELATKVDELLQQQFSFDASKLDYQQLKKRRSARAISICYNLYKKSNVKDWITRAWAFSESAKAAVLSDAIRQQIAYGLVANDTLIQQINNVLLKQSELKKELFETTAAVQLLQLQKTSDSLNSSYISLTTKLKVDNPQAAELLHIVSNNNFLDNPLFTNMPCVEFFSGDSSNYFIFSKNKEGALAFNCCSIADSTLLNWRSFFKTPEACNNKQPQFLQQSLVIYKTLLAPVLLHNDYTSLIIIPDGELCNLPWDALVTDVSLETDWHKMPFIIKKTAITQGFSLQNLVQQHERKQGRNSLCMAAFAPVFANSERGQYPLPASVQELAAIKKLQPCGKYLTNENASVAAFKNIQGSTDMLHISTHAIGGKTEDSCKLQFYDSALYLHQLNQPVNAKLVVLSACETGTGKFENGEGVYSMARGFYLAGAKNVITSLWQVNDESTAAIFQNFYRQKGDPYSMLRIAKLQYIDAANNSNASPYYWAAFVNTGYDPVAANNVIYWWLTGATGALALLLLLVFWYKKNTKRSA